MTTSRSLPTSTRSCGEATSCLVRIACVKTDACIESQQQAWPQQALEARRLALPLCPGHPATGLVNIQRATPQNKKVTPHNHPSDIDTKCVKVLERDLCHNEIIELHIEEGEVNFFSILQLAEQHTSDSDDGVVCTREQRLLVQQKSRRQLQQLFNNKKKKKDKKQHFGGERQEAAQRADIEHKQSQAPLQHYALAH